MSALPELDRSSAARLPLFALIPLLILVPPETRGVSAAAGAILIALAWIAGSSSGAKTRRAVTVTVVALAVVLPIVLWSATPAAALAPTVLFLLAAGTGIAAARAADVPRFGERVVRIFAGLATLVSSYGIYQSVYGLERLAARIAADPTIPDSHDLAVRAATGRALGTFSTPAALGAFLSLSLPLTVALAFSSRGRVRAAWGAAVFLQLAALLASASATATAALLVALLLGALFWKGTRRFAVVALMVVTVSFAIVVAMRGAQILSVTDKDSSLRLRAGNFRSASVMALDHPWLGVGPGGFAETYPRYRRPSDNEIRHVHNLPLEMTAETGFVIGPLLSAIFFMVFMAPLLRRKKELEPWRRALALGLAAFAIHNLVDYTAYMPSLLWSAALLRGLLTTRHDTAGSIDLSRSEPRSQPWMTWGAVAAIGVAAVLQVLTGLAEDQRFGARAAAYAGDPATAESMAMRAVKLAPWSGDAALFLARATLGGDEIVEASPERKALALRRAKRAVDVSPVSAAARGTRARARMVNGDVAGAYADLVEAARLYPLHEAYRYDRDYLAVRMKQRPEAGVAP